MFFQMCRKSQSHRKNESVKRRLPLYLQLLGRLFGCLGKLEALLEARGGSLLKVLLLLPLLVARVSHPRQLRGGGRAGVCPLERGRRLVARPF